jgi:hypothetical protein
VSDERSVMRTGLLVALVLIVLRIILEQLGAPEMANNVFGVAWLYPVIPVFFGLSIAGSGLPRPYRALLKDVFLFGVYTRLMVMITYMLAYVLRWQAPRFSTKLGGNVGDNIGFVNGFVFIPVRNAIIWVVFATLVGMAVGGITIRLRQGKPSGAVVS